jgi:hypothetical protein
MTDKRSKAKIITLDEFSFKEKAYYRMVDKYFVKRPKALKRTIEIINKKSKISLRILEWFVTNYAKKHYIMYDLYDEEEPFNVYMDYQSNIDTYKKFYFDPFRRNSKFYYKCHDEDFLTTISQLNFFRWIISKKVLDYVEKHYDDLILAMNVSNKQKRTSTKEKKTKTIKMKNKKIKVKATRFTDENETTLILTFD